jgi:hypothetical protein
MLVAVLIACLVAEPGECRTEEIRLVSTMPIPAMLEAQQRAAEYFARNPRYRCGGVRVVRGQGV